TRRSSGKSASCRATCRARSTRPRAATSTPAAPMRSPSARWKPPCCAKLLQVITFPVICASPVVPSGAERSAVEGPLFVSDEKRPLGYARGDGFKGAKQQNGRLGLHHRRRRLGGLRAGQPVDRGSFGQG